ncbi:hypothetical protein EDC04DRAFT_2561460, partial [Pisolithus marmoratus]
MHGPDVDHFAQHGGGSHDAQVLIGAAQDDGEDTPTRIKLLLEQFFYDMLEESPNKKAATDGPWTNIPKWLCTQEATEHLYQSFGLPFVAAQYKFCTPEQWNLHFSHMFPLTVPITCAQNFGKATYYHQWLDLIASLGSQSTKRLRATIWAKFDSLIWIPWTGSDQMWCTRPVQSRGWFALPIGSHPAGPQIAINPNACH